MMSQESFDNEKDENDENSPKITPTSKTLLSKVPPLPIGRKLELDWNFILKFDVLNIKLISINSISIILHICIYIYKNWEIIYIFYLEIINDWLEAKL